MKQRLAFVPLLTLFLTALVIPTQSVFAANFTANSVATLNNAIEAANADPATPYTSILTADITLTSADENDLTYGSTGLAPITSYITIEGQGHKITCRSSAPSVHILRVAPGANLTLNNLTISGGDISAMVSCDTLAATCGGGILTQGNLTLTNVTISGNKALVSGGVYCDGDGIYNAGVSFNITSSVFSGNQATTGVGGAVNGLVNAASSTFTNNSAINGGVFYTD